MQTRGPVLVTHVANQILYADEEGKKNVVLLLLSQKKAFSEKTTKSRTWLTQTDTDGELLNPQVAGTNRVPNYSQKKKRSFFLPR